MIGVLVLLQAYRVYVDDREMSVSLEGQGQAEMKIYFAGAIRGGREDANWSNYCDHSARFLPSISLMKN
jgi:hypothetical protein